MHEEPKRLRVGLGILQSQRDGQERSLLALQWFYRDVKTADRFGPPLPDLRANDFDAVLCRIEIMKLRDDPAGRFLIHDLDQILAFAQGHVNIVAEAKRAVESDRVIPLSGINDSLGVHVHDEILARAAQRHGKGIFPPYVRAKRVKHGNRVIPLATGGSATVEVHAIIARAAICEIVKKHEVPCFAIEFSFVSHPDRIVAGCARKIVEFVPHGQDAANAGVARVTAVADLFAGLVLFIG
jgi:hypothetical protein